MSVSPAKVLDALAQIGPPGQTRAKIDEVMEKLKAQGRMDFEKEFLGNLGPKMALYLAPGRSAATTDETPEGAVKAGSIDPMAMFSSLQSALPKPTLVAELRDPVGFGKALDVLMITVNKELKAQAIEKAAQEGAAEEAGAAAGGSPGRPQAAGPGRGHPGRGPGGDVAGGERAARKRNPKETPAPEFRLMPGTVKTYMLFVPTESPLKLGPPGVHPTLRIEGKYLAVSSTSEAARVALETIKKKGWKPSAEIEQAVSHIPSNPIFVAVGDPRETVPSLLASLPGTLQTQINTIIAMSAAGPGGAMAGAPGAGPQGFRPGGASAPVAAGPGGLGMAPGGPGGRRGGRPGMNSDRSGGGAAAPGRLSGFRRRTAGRLSRNARHAYGRRLPGCPGGPGPEWLGLRGSRHDPAQGGCRQAAQGRRPQSFDVPRHDGRDGG